MQLSSVHYRSPRIWLAAFLAIVLLSPSVLALQGTATAPAKTAAAKLTSTERKASEHIKQETIREITIALSSKEFEGRGTGQPGADKAAQYMADRFAKLGLKPGGPNGSYLQPIKFRSTEMLMPLSLRNTPFPVKPRIRLFSSCSRSIGPLVDSIALVPPANVNPLMIESADPVLSSTIITAGASGLTIDSLATRPLASTPACAPSRLTVLGIKMFSV